VSNLDRLLAAVEKRCSEVRRTDPDGELFRALTALRRALAFTAGYAHGNRHGLLASGIADEVESALRSEP
jgi:hypothetical protein